MSIPDHTSSSQVNTYLKCGLGYYFRYIRKLIVPPKGAMTTGSGIHLGVGKNMAQKIESGNDLHPDEVAGVCEQYLREHEEGTLWDTDFKFDTALLASDKLCRKHTKEIAPSIQPIAVEKKIELDLPGTDKFLTGYIDLIDNENTIIDNKTGRKTWSQFQVDTDFQLSVYAFEQFAEAEKPEEKVVNVRIDNLVLLKEPKIAQIKGTRRLSDILWTMGVIKSTLDGIERGIWLPAAPGSWNCSEKWCGYWEVCHEEMMRR